MRARRKGCLFLKTAYPRTGSINTARPCSIGCLCRTLWDSPTTTINRTANQSPSYDQIYRVDYNITEKWRLFGRLIKSQNTSNSPYGRLDTANNLGLAPFYANNYSWPLTVNLATIITPTLTNEFQFGYTVNGIPGDPKAGTSIGQVIKLFVTRRLPWQRCVTARMRSRPRGGGGRVQACYLRVQFGCRPVAPAELDLEFGAPLELLPTTHSGCNGTAELINALSLPPFGLRATFGLRIAFLDAQRTLY